MLKKIFDLLMCPYCGENPSENPSLELYELQTSEIPQGTRINQGIIYCKSCQRFYMIKDEIIYMSMDNNRRKETELAFLDQWLNKLPAFIT